MFVEVRPINEVCKPVIDALTVTSWVLIEVIAVARVVSAPFSPDVAVPAGNGQFTLGAVSRPTNSGPVRVVQADRFGFGFGQPADCASATRTCWLQ